MKISKLANELTGQKMFQIMDRARQLESSGRNIIHMEIGDPNFKSPPSAIESCKLALDDDCTHYVSSYGLNELREVGSAMTLRSRGYKPDIKQIVITAGANVQLFYTLACLVEPGDDVMVITPCFVTYEPLIRLIGANAICCEAKEENNFEPTIEDIVSLISIKTKIIIINSPNNPTGAVYSEDFFRQLYDICDKKGIYILSDEVYGRMIYDDSPNSFFSPSSIDECKKLVIVSHSLSKSYAMTGWRIGAITAPTFIAEKIALLLETTSSCVPPFIQKGAVGALLKGNDYANHMMVEYKLRRDLFKSLLSELPILNGVNPNGTFYYYVNIRKTGMSSEQFSSYILNSCGIATCPGNFFGKGGEGYVRFCFSRSYDDIVECFDRLKKEFK